MRLLRLKDDTTTISPTYDEGSIGDGPTWNTRNTELNIHLSGSEKYLEEIKSQSKWENGMGCRIHLNGP